MTTRSETAGRRIQCPHYVQASEGTKRCKNYIDGGSCKRRQEFQCTEWLRVNGYPTPKQDPLAVDLLGDPVATPKLPPKPIRGPTSGSAAKPGQPSPNDTPSPHEATRQSTRPMFMAPSPKPLSGFDVDAIESFKKLNVAIHFNSALGEFWLVPKYTGSARKEMTPEHLNLICQSLMAFPGATVVDFENLADKETSKSPYSPLRKGRSERSASAQTKTETPPSTKGGGGISTNHSPQHPAKTPPKENHHE